MPYNGKTLKLAVTPNNPKNAGNNPTKHPGQAPPKTPIKTPKLVNPFSPLLILFNSLNFKTIKLIFTATKEAINKLKKTYGIPKLKL